MKKFFKWFAISAGSLIVLVTLILLGLVINFSTRLSKNYEITPKNLVISNDSASIERGKHLVSALCTGCHGENMGGMVMFEDPALARIPGPNLTPGKGSKTKSYKDIDWVRSIRHSVNPGGRPLLVMPGKDFFYLSDKDLSSVIGYLKTLQPVDSSLGEFSMTMLAKLIASLGGFGDIISTENLDHTNKVFDHPDINNPVSYGDYLVKVGGCRTCHGASLAGGKDPNPAAPPGSNLTRGVVLAKYNESQFITALKTGVSYNGRQMSEFMPWKTLGRLSDDELKAVYSYLMAQPALPDAIK